MAISNSPHPVSDNSKGGDSTTRVGLLKLECSWKTQRFTIAPRSSLVAPRTYTVHLCDWYLVYNINIVTCYFSFFQGKNTISVTISYTLNWTSNTVSYNHLRYLLTSLLAKPKCYVPIHNWNTYLYIFEFLTRVLHKKPRNDYTKQPMGISFSSESESESKQC